MSPLVIAALVLVGFAVLLLLLGWAISTALADTDEGRDDGNVRR